MSDLIRAQVKCTWNIIMIDNTLLCFLSFLFTHFIFFICIFRNVRCKILRCGFCQSAVGIVMVIDMLCVLEKIAWYWRVEVLFACLFGGLFVCLCIYLFVPLSTCTVPRS